MYAIFTPLRLSMGELAAAKAAAAIVLLELKPRAVWGCCPKPERPETGGEALAPKRLVVIEGVALLLLLVPNKEKPGACVVGMVLLLPPKENPVEG
jgi:hypothetical protein